MSGFQEKLQTDRDRQTDRQMGGQIAVISYDFPCQEKKDKKILVKQRSI